MPLPRSRRDGVAASHGSSISVCRYGAGEVLTLRAGDMAMLPAGTGHKRDWASDDFLVVGAYPDGRDFDICRGDPAEHDHVRARIAKVLLPARDPVLGGDGVAAWRGA